MNRSFIGMSVHKHRVCNRRRKLFTSDAYRAQLIQIQIIEMCILSIFWKHFQSALENNLSKPRDGNGLLRVAPRLPRVAPAADCTTLHTAATLQSISHKAVSRHTQHVYLHLVGHIQFRLLCVCQIANSVNLDTGHMVIFVGYVIEPENGQTTAGRIDWARHGDCVCSLPSKVFLEDLSLCSRRRQSEHSTTTCHSTACH